MGMKGLTDKRIEQLQRQPIIETQVSRSKDGHYLIHRTIITDIKPIGFYKKVLENTGGPVL